MQEDEPIVRQRLVVRPDPKPLEQRTQSGPDWHNSPFLALRNLRANVNQMPVAVDVTETKI